MKGYLDYYYKWMETGRMPEGGLCCSLPKELLEKEVFQLLIPTTEDIDALEAYNLPTIFWGRGSWIYEMDDLTPLRETILILAAILNDEL